MNKEFDVLDFFFNWKGRIGRKHFWFGHIGLAVVSNIIMAILANYFKIENLFSDSIIGLILFWTTMVIFLFAGFCLDIKRYHDRGKSGHWLWLYLIPIIGAIWILIELGFLKGTKGSNKYGEDTLKIN